MMAACGFMQAQRSGHSARIRFTLGQTNLFEALLFVPGSRFGCSKYGCNCVFKVALATTRFLVQTLIESPPPSGYFC
jgi:hypothetical protein